MNRVRFVLLGLTLWFVAADIGRAATRFLDSEKRPIDEIRITGNREITTAEILRALEMGPDDIGNAVKVMKGVLPYFYRVDWRVEDEANHLVVTITVIEKLQRVGPFNLDGRWHPTGGVNRVHGIRLGPYVELWRQPNVKTPSRGTLYGEITYGFADERWYYALGGRLSWGWLKAHGVTLTERFHRSLGVSDPDAMPSNGEQLWTALLYGGDFRQYYLREGAEGSIRWHPETQAHSVEAVAVAEEHGSLNRASDWSLFRPTSLKWPNRPATPGQLRSVLLRYDFDTRTAPTTGLADWHHTLEVEQAFPSWGSDFDFTRWQAHLRYYRPHGEHRQFRVRLKLGASQGDVPLQRRFLLGGPGNLRGYDLNELDGRHVALLNVECDYHLLVFFADAGQVAEKVADFDPAAFRYDVGIGVHLDDFFRLNVSQALEAGRSPQVDIRWSRFF